MKWGNGGEEGPRVGKEVTPGGRGLRGEGGREGRRGTGEGCHSIRFPPTHPQAG